MWRFNVAPATRINITYINEIIHNTVNTSTHITKTPMQNKTHTYTHQHITKHKTHTYTHPHLTKQVTTNTVHVKQTQYEIYSNEIVTT